MIGQTGNFVTVFALDRRANDIIGSVDGATAAQDMFENCGSAERFENFAGEAARADAGLDDADGAGGVHGELGSDAAHRAGTHAEKVAQRFNDPIDVLLIHADEQRQR